ncbi:putative oxoglutarate/iron-dependent dioxygenase, isopenicillin N synthase [Rosa chinensis]|uniref:Putative oxoglutarate/iron-dependent dioxygenase, isopenicillin N synthase n=1 Tax=Rosa chinensis TaxID=74649 RepID=A0A2P6RP28_ROSCH|nr:probable inactive 2-oxoglutarate-dependent dioxygenase AOP2 [Rosa chinensis]PRQ48186.1 putative oxoglutarate/iron-dependent dioxygenase, isopenicillin N synthase [Rosa chinensis]
MTQIPVVDFSDPECLKPGTSSWLSARNQVCNALEDQFGCFTAILSNKVTLELHNTVFGAMNELFESPDGIKDQNKYEKWPFCGHFKSNSVLERLGIYDPTNPEEIHNFSRLFWPTGNDQFCDGVHLYVKVMKELDQAVTRMVFENYGVEKHHDDHIESSFYCFQFSKYAEPKISGSNVGIVSHTDKNFTSILHQNQINGLEIYTKDGEWIGFDPHPLPSSFIFIASDVFQVWSNDRIRACKHRVNLIHSDQIRYSFGLFSLKRGVTTVPEELVDKDHPLKYKPLNQVEYIQAQGYKDSEGRECKLKAFCGI